MNRQVCDKLFVYGTLRNGFKNPAYEYMAENFDCLGEAIVRGKIFSNGSFPVAVPTAEDYFIEGELYQLKKDFPYDWVFTQLDDYEGVNGDDFMNSKPFYKRLLVKAHQAGEAFDAWIYWYNGDTNGMQKITNDALQKFLADNK